MKTEKSTYGELEIQILSDINEWAREKYGTDAVLNFETPTISEITEEYWKEKLE